MRKINDINPGIVIDLNSGEKFVAPPYNFYDLGDFNEQISDVYVYNIAKAFKDSKYPMSIDVKSLNGDFTNNIKKLGSSPKGSGHDNFLNGCLVSFDLTLSIKAWVEAERYHFLEFISSQSTMHRITRFDISTQCNEYVDSKILARVKELKQEGDFLKLIYNIPTGFKLTAGMVTNYRQLKTIYDQRKCHRLPEWRGVCEWIETLPYMKEFLSLDIEDNE